MRSLVLILLALAASVLSYAQSDEQGAQLSWDKSNYDFGEVEAGERVEFTFKFHNSGNEPLMITNVTTQCGCTAPKGWSRDPILPGHHGEITLVFDSTGKFGRVNKVATVMSNAVNKDGGQILLSGNIIEKKAANK
jgi:hypothetical protein